MIRVLGVLAAAFPVLAFCQPVATLEKGETGKIVFQSLTPSGSPNGMAGAGRNLPPVEVWGDLKLPRGAAGKVPAMILLHASGGVSDRNLPLWEDKFHRLGIATFTIDSLGGRGLNWGNIPHRHAQMVDAYEALKLLGTHPGIDAARVGLIGFSLGAIAAIEAPMEQFRDLYGFGGLRFAAYFSLYPACNFRYMGSKVRPEPVVVFIPEKEDWTVPAYCETYVNILKSGGGNARAVVLAGAYHGFDQLGLNQFKAAYPNSGTCNVELALGKGMRRADTQEPLADAAAYKAYMSTCSGKQASLVGDTGVLRRVEEEIRQVLSAAFGMPLK